MNRAKLEEFVDQNGETLDEAEALATLGNRFCSAEICVAIAQSTRLASFYAVRVALVANRHTPQAYSLKFVPQLYRRDLLVLSTDMKVLPTVRRAIDNQLRAMLKRLTLGERMTLARLCSREMIPDFLDDPDPKVFEALLVNPRLREEEVVRFIDMGNAPDDQIRLLSSHPRWRERYAVRRALVMNEGTPRAIAASMLRSLNRSDVQLLFSSKKTSRYLLNCIERLGLLAEPGDGERLAPWKASEADE